MEKQKKTKKEVGRNLTSQKDLKKTKKVRRDLTSQKDLKFVKTFNPQHFHSEADSGDSVDPKPSCVTTTSKSLNREEPNADEGNT